MTKEKIVGLVTIILVLSLLFFFAFYLANKNKKEEALEKQYVVYQDKDLDIKLKGDYVEYISLGDKYVEKGISVKDKKNKDLGDNVDVVYYKNGEQVFLINSAELGEYLVEYTVSYDNKYQKVDKVIIVIDDKAPKISFPKNTVLSSSETLNYDLKKDVKVSDNSGNATLTFDGTLSNSPGSYIITYKAVDKSGNEKIKKRLIKVK